MAVLLVLFFVLVRVRLTWACTGVGMGVGMWGWTGTSVYPSIRMATGLRCALVTAIEPIAGRRACCGSGVWPGRKQLLRNPTVTLAGVPTLKVPV